ncbi:HTH-type transcriptional regulator ybiH [Salmonella enterica subsp. arizonae]|nr:HTH-type transcriptional regulator ybiH [Salmonella enterica subsp. arizonae]
MNIPTTTTKGEQAKSQLIAAALAQFGEYGLHATTRDIAALAGQNIAAITYYFGSKRGFIPRLRPVDCRFSWRKISPPC